MEKKLEIILAKMQKICAKNEHYTFEIQKKLSNFEINSDEISEIIEVLTKEKFLDDQRFANAFAIDKLKFNYWGKKKIAFELKMKKIDNFFIQNALNSLDEEKYCEVLENELRKKLKSLKTSNLREIKMKLFSFAQTRGFESDIISKVLGKIFAKNE